MKDLEIQGMPVRDQDVAYIQNAHIPLKIGQAFVIEGLFAFPAENPSVVV